MLALTAIQNSAPLFGFGVVIVTLWAGRWDLAFFGLSRLRLRDLLRASKYTVVILLAVDALAQPALERGFGVSPADLSTLQFLKGNVRNLILFLGFMWAVAAVGEEMVFRGYLMKGWARCLGDSDRNWLLGAVFSSVVFGLAHGYQGPSGVLSTALVGGILAMQFYRGRDRLGSCMLTHGLYDSVGTILLFLGRPDALGRLFF
jgi:uncharacterized protein